MPQVWFHIFWALLPNSETCEDWSLGNIRTKLSLIGHKSFISHQNYQNNNRIYDICRDSQSLICVFKTYLYKMKLLKSNISGLWFLSHHSGGFDLSHEVSISISWWSLLCSSGRRERCERCECGTGLRSIKLDGLGWTTSGIAWCHMSSWSWIMIQTHVVSCLGDPALGVAICNLPNGEAVVVVGNPPRPPPNCFNAIPNLLEIPEAWIFVEISVDPQNYRSFPHIFLGREMLTWRCKMPTRSNRCLGMWSQNLFDFIHMFLSKNAAHCRSQGLLMAPRIW